MYSALLSAQKQNHRHYYSYRCCDVGTDSDFEEANHAFNDCRPYQKDNAGANEKDT
jgi:hypothetical protein